MTASEDYNSTLTHKKTGSPNLTATPYRSQMLPTQSLQKTQLEVVVNSVCQKVNVNAIRSLFSFIGTGEESPFNMPSKQLFFSRIRSNMDFYCANYVALTALVLCCVMIYHPLLLLSTFALGAGWHFVLNISNKQEPFVIMNKELGSREQTLIMSAVSVVFVVLFMIPMFIETIFLSAIICAAHSSLRETAMRSEAQHFRTKGTDESEDNV